MEIKDILSRIGFVRNSANLSARKLRLEIGMSFQYVAKLESGSIVLTLEMNAFSVKILKILKTIKTLQASLKNFPLTKKPI
ncbi:MAG: hypothetical protein J6A51_01185 [Clostridia bacterium]|nr:hypothetical protein [Clostridia bacterium]